MISLDRSSVRPALRGMIWLAIPALTAALSGCEEPNPLKGVVLHPVTGRVLLADGQPLTSGSVVFVGTKSTSSARLDGDGGFSFKNEGGDGLPAGEYLVRIENSPSAGSSTKSKGKLRFSTSYLDEDSSNLKAMVTEDETKNNFEFKLDATNSASSAPARRRRK